MDAGTNLAVDRTRHRKNPQKIAMNRFKIWGMNRVCHLNNIDRMIGSEAEITTPQIKPVTITTLLLLGEYFRSAV